MTRFYYQYTQKYGSPRHDEKTVDIESIAISADGKTVNLHLSELKAWHIHELQITGLKSAEGIDLANGYFVYTLNRLLENTPPEPLQAGAFTPWKPKKKASKPVGPIPLKNPKGAVHQAADAKRNGPAFQSRNGGFTGRGYIDYGNGDQSIEWTVTSKKAGKADLLIRYALAGGSRPLGLTINGERKQTLPFPASGDWTTWKDQTAKVTLKTGKNVIKLESTGKSGPNIDHLQIVGP